MSGIQLGGNIATGSIAKNRILFRDGVPVAMKEGGLIRIVDRAAPAVNAELEGALVKRKLAVSVRAYLGTAG